MVQRQTIRAAILVGALAVGCGLAQVDVSTTSRIVDAGGRHTFPPAISTPPPNSVLTSNTVTFVGDHTDQDGVHSLWVGTAAGAKNIHVGPMSDHSQTVEGLPTSGTIYVRYWSSDGGDPSQNSSWSYTDHTYTMNVSVPSTLPRLRVSSNGRYFETEDGHDFFWLGNMPWLPVRISRSEMSQYLDARQAQGHTSISIAAHNFALHNANNPLYNGEGAFEQFGPVVLNEAYWTYIDWIVDEAAAHNLYVALAAMWGYDGDMLFNEPYQDNYDYGYFLGQRYGDRTNVIFVAAGEFINIKCATEDYCSFTGPITPEQKTLLRRIADGFRDGSARHDPEGKILITLHGTTINEAERVGGEFHDDAWVDFYLEQTWNHISYTDEAFTFDWNLSAPIKPALQGETGFWEQSIRRPGDPADPLQAWEQRLQGYWSVFYGSCGTTYSSFFWDNIPGDFDLPGAWDMRHLKDLILSKPMRDYVPDQSLITSDTTGNDDVGNYNSPKWGAVDRRVATRAANKTWAMFYTTQGKAIGVRRSRLVDGTMNAYWYNPRNGLWNDDMGSESSSKNAAQAGIATGAGASDMTFDPPGDIGPDNDWVLVLE